MQTVQAKVSYRIPLVGGFADFPRFYRKYGGQSITCAIDKFLTVSIGENKAGGLIIESKADLAWGMGLGSSGAYHAALIQALARSRGQKLPKLAVARLAYDLETGIETDATGRQDTIACLFKGISKISYFPDDSAAVSRVQISAEWRKKLGRRLLLFDTGVRRRAGDSIRDILSRKNESVLSRIAELPDRLLQAWQDQDLDYLAPALDLQQQYRSQASPSCTSAQTEKLLGIARRCGAGARLTGAGLGSLLCYCPEEKQQQLRESLGIPEIKFSILW